MTDELNRASSEPETTNPEETMHPIEGDITAVEENTMWDDMPGKVTVELPPDWLKPMEEDEDEGVDGLRSSERITRRTNDGVYVPLSYILFAYSGIFYSLGVVRCLEIF